MSEAEKIGIVLRFADSVETRLNRSESDVRNATMGLMLTLEMEPDSIDLAKKALNGIIAEWPT